MPRMPTKKYNGPKTAKPKNWLRNKEHETLYNSKRWRKFSLAYKMDHPVCELEGCTQSSYYTDHIIPISDGGAVWDTDNLQALCKSCNGSKTAKQKNKVHL